MIRRRWKIKLNCYSNILSAHQRKHSQAHWHSTLFFCFFLLAVFHLHKCVCGVFCLVFQWYSYLILGNMFSISNCCNRQPTHTPFYGFKFFFQLFLCIIEHFILSLFPCSMLLLSLSLSISSFVAVFSSFLWSIAFIRFSSSIPLLSKLKCINILNMRSQTNLNRHCWNTETVHFQPANKILCHDEITHSNSFVHLLDDEFLWNVI